MKTEKKARPQKTANSQGTIAFRQFRRNKLAMAGAIGFIVIVFLCFNESWLTPYDYAEQDVSNQFASLSLEHPFGTDQFGRDLLTRLLRGGQISLMIGTASCLLGTIVGAILGCSAAFFGGVYETIVLRLMDILMAIPSILMAAAISTALGEGLQMSIIAIGISNIASMTRVVHAAGLTVAGQDYMESAQAIGASRSRKVFSHVMPNCMPTIIVRFAMTYGHSITAIASLAFLGLGVKAPTPEWGAILNAGKIYIRSYPPIVLFPGMIIALTMMCVNFIGDGLRDALDPRMKR